jgi:hypothetical protein
LPTWISHRVPGEPFSRIGEHPVNVSFHVPVVTFMSPLCHPHAWLPRGFVPFLLSPLLLYSRPRLEVLNASQNRIQHIATLSFLPSLVVLDLGEWTCLHKSARGSDASVMRSLQRRPSPTAPHDVLFMADSAAIPLWTIILFSHASLGHNPPPLLLIFVLVVPVQMTTPLMNSSLTASCLDCVYCV